MAPPPLLKLVLQFSDGSEISSPAMALNSCLRRFCLCGGCGAQQLQGSESCSASFFSSQVVNFLGAELQTSFLEQTQRSTGDLPPSTNSKASHTSPIPAPESAAQDQSSSFENFAPTPSQLVQEPTSNIQAATEVPAQSSELSRSHAQSFYFGPQRFSVVTACSDFEFNRQRSCMQSSFVKSTASFSCGHCDKVYVRRGNLQIHLRIHLGVYPFRCHKDGCQRKFISRPGLLCHIRGSHPECSPDSILDHNLTARNSIRIAHRRSQHKGRRNSQVSEIHKSTAVAGEYNAEAECSGSSIIIPATINTSKSGHSTGTGATSFVDESSQSISDPCNSPSIQLWTKCLRARDSIATGPGPDSNEASSSRSTSSLGEADDDDGSSYSKDSEEKDAHSDSESQASSSDSGNGAEEEGRDLDPNDIGDEQDTRSQNPKSLRCMINLRSLQKNICPELTRSRPVTRLQTRRAMIVDKFSG